MGTGLSQQRCGHRNMSYQESNLYPSTCSVKLRTIHVTANLVLVRENLPQIVTKRHVNSPWISDVSRVHSERSAKRMKVDLAAASAAAAAAAAVAAPGKFRNDSLLLSSSAGQSPVLKVAVTFQTNWWTQRLPKSVLITDCCHHNKQTTNSRALLSGCCTHILLTPFSRFLLPQCCTVFPVTWRSLKRRDKRLFFNCTDIQ